MNSNNGNLAEGLQQILGAANATAGSIPLGNGAHPNLPEPGVYDYMPHLNPPMPMPLNVEELAAETKSMVKFAVVGPVDPQTD